MTDISSSYGITENTTLLDGFTNARGGTWGDGVGFPGAVPLEAVRELIGWEPIEAQVQGVIRGEKGRMKAVVSDPNRKMLVHPRTMQPIQIHGKGYQVHPYEKTLVANAATITDSDLDVARAGTLDNGGKAFVQYEFPENIQAGAAGAEPVVFRPFLNAATSLDGSMATSYFPGTGIIVCKNTMARELRNAKLQDTLYKIRHTRHSLLHLQDAREVVGVVFAIADEFTAEVERLTGQYVSDEAWQAFLDETVPLPKDQGHSRTIAENKRGSLQVLWDTDERVAPWKNSSWGVLAATNTWMNNIQTVRGASRDERNVARLINGTFEKADALTLKALAKVTA